jgi:hypothetical protein
MTRFSLRARLLILAGVFLLLFGWRCLNYTKASGWEHHTAFAEQHGLPRPSERILWSGATSLLVGGLLIGYAIGSRRPTS